MLLQRLSDAFGVSGCEEEVRSILAEAVRPHVDELRTDSMGNLIAIKRARAGISRPLRVMLAAHMDEVGLMITHIEKDGLLRFQPVGGIDPRLLPAKQVRIGRERVPGIIGVKPIHLLKPEERERVVPVEQLYIDIGAVSKEAAEKRVKVGDYAVFATRFGHHGLEGESRLVRGKAFDDRAGCAVLAAVLEGEPYPVEVAGVFTVQEEVGLRGARVAAYALEPDVAIALEGTICDDLPKEKDQSPVTRVGKGPAITIADRSVVADRRLVQLLVDTAEKQGLPYQFKEPALGGTDAGAIHLTRAGVPSAALAVPSRYIHGPASVLSLDDLEHTVALVRAVLPRLQDWPDLNL
ncbi:MAG: M42 family metallopeptidase [Anaerolineae bacterium]